jgi:peptide/nickel transport system substrate-binding protein
MRRRVLPETDRGKIQMNKPFTALAAAAIAATAAAPQAAFAETPPDTLVIADKIDDIVSIDPAEAFEFSGTDMLNNVYDTLVELDPTQPGALVPGLAESWSVAEDGVTYTFRMRPGVTFASGNPVRAEDAAFSLQRVIKLDKTPSFILTQFGFTPENVEERIRAEGDALVFVTSEPFAPSFVYNCLTSIVASIVDKETVMANEVDGDLGYEYLKGASAGTGAYVLRSYKPADSYVLDAREGHWRGDAALKRVFLRHVPEPATQRLLIERGDVDIARTLTPVDVDGLAGNPDVTVTSDVGGYIHYLALNQKREPLNNPLVIDAMRWLIDYEGMANSFLKGQQMVHQAFLPRGYLGSIDETPYSLDVEKAKALLEEAGVGPFSTTISVRNSQDRMEMAQSIQNTFAQAGITVELSVGTGAEVLGDYRARNHDITLQAWGPDYPDPHTNASTFAVNPDNSDEANLTGQLAWRTAYEPGEVMEMTMAAVVERDADKRAAMYQEIQRRHRDDSPFIAMFQSIDQTALRANVENFFTGGSTDQATYWLVTK